MKPSEFITRGWCRRFSAVNEKFTYAGVLDEDAVAWCATGAVWAAYPYEMLRRESVLNRLRTRIPGTSIVDWNDDLRTTKESVIQAFRSIGE